MRGRRPPQARALQATAQARLRRFRRGTLLAVALTAMILLVWNIDAAPPITLPASSSATSQQASGPLRQDVEVQSDDEAAAPPVDDEGLDGEGSDGSASAATADGPTVPADPVEAADQAVRTMGALLRGAYAMLPRIIIALALLALTALIARLISALLRRLLRSWERADAAAAMVQVLFWLVAIGAALSVLAGDARALVGSVGLAGLALSWALQAPIESFTGWLMNSFKGYYRLGDRIAVGEVFGDVYKIDILTTTVWEAGGPGKPVEGAQPTGAMITFPNSDVLRSNIVNYTRKFPYVWDEVTIQVASETDLPYAVEVLERVALRVLGTEMSQRAEAYREMLQRARLTFDIATEPRVFVSLEESWINLTIRYIVPARQRRTWSSDLQLQASIELTKPEHRSRILPGYPRTDVRLQQDGQSP